MNNDVTGRKPGRPKAIHENLLLEVLSLYEGGLGYRAIARELRKQGISVNWSTIRRVIKANLGRNDEKYSS